MTTEQTALIAAAITVSALGPESAHMNPREVMRVAELYVGWLERHL